MQLSEAFFWEVVEPLLRKHVPALQGRYAAGLVGYGSDVLGFDDELSRDHEWGPRGQLWLSPRDYRRYATRIDGVLTHHLPGEFLGFPARFIVDETIGCLVAAPPGQPERSRHHMAITTVPRHLRLQFGIRRLPIDDLDWLCLPEQKLLELTRGKIFSDAPGEITRARQAFAFFPEGVWRMKMLYVWECANELLDVVPLHVQRGDARMARLILSRLVERVMRLVFLLNRRYCPGTPKWIGREFDTLPRLAKETGPLLNACLALADLRQAPAHLEILFQALVEEHNRLGITRPVALEPARFGRGLVSFDLHGPVEALRESLPPALRDLEIHGGLDQWITNPDLLIWAEQYRKFKSVYKKKSRNKRDGIGDRMV